MSYASPKNMRVGLGYQVAVAGIFAAATIFVQSGIQEKQGMCYN